MEDKRCTIGSILSHSGDYILQMDPESTVSSIIPPHHDPIKSIDICYSYQSSDQQHPVLNIDALNTLLNDNYLKQQQQLEAKLVDLLRDEETFCGKDIIKVNEL